MHTYLTYMQAIKEMNLSRHWDAVQAQATEREAQNAAAAQDRRNATLNRIRHFRQLEETSQRHKSLQAQVADVHQGILRSQILR